MSAKKKTENFLFSLFSDDDDKKNKVAEKLR
jgi:hypothetical protein